MIVHSLVLAAGSIGAAADLFIDAFLFHAESLLGRQRSPLPCSIPMDMLTSPAVCPFSTLT